MDSPVPNLEELFTKARNNLLLDLRREVASLLGRDSHNFPGAQPISFARKHLRELRERDYFLCEKSDGVRSLLYFTKDDAANDSRELHYLIDRKNAYYWAEGLHFPRPGATRDAEPQWDAFHVDTLLDGELLWDLEPTTDEHGETVRDEDGNTVKHKVLKYLVFDCLVLDGQNLCSFPLDKRLAHFHENVMDPYIKLRKRWPNDAERFPFAIEKKDVQRAYGTQAMFKDILPQLKHGSDGLIFTCKDTGYKFGTDENIVKWKPVLENSIDFKLELEWMPLQGLVNGRVDGGYKDGDDEDVEWDYEGMPTFKLLIFAGEGRDKEYGMMHVTEDEWESMKAWSVKKDDGLDGQIVECHKDTEGRWRFGRFRDDKAEANHISVAEKVLQSIEDGVTEKDLIDAGLDIKRSWKAREEQVNARKRQQEAERKKRAEDAKRKKEQAS